MSMQIENHQRVFFSLQFPILECCIFHKTHDFGESSTESDSSDYIDSSDEEK